MSKFAIIATSGTVIGIAKADSPMAPDWVAVPDDTPVGIGWTYNAGVFSPPAPTVPAVRGPVRIRFQALLDRMTQAEAINYELAKVIDPAGTVAVKRAAAKWRVREASFRSVSAVRPTSPAITNFFNDMEGSILAVGRAAEILTAPIQPDEEA